MVTSAASKHLRIDSLAFSGRLARQCQPTGKRQANNNSAPTFFYAWSNLVLTSLTH